ncbi:MAG: urea carboxylase-associated family protein [Chloroflexi bacterium]|nr:urea carboxylase-associated family protein [Chloroflexota bacterium]
MATLRDFTLLTPRAQLDKGFYDKLRESKSRYKPLDRFVIPPFEGRGFLVNKGQSFRVVQEEGVQIGDVCFWNVHDPREMYSLSRTWAIEGWAVRVFTRLWSDVPWLRPLATCIEDTVVTDPSDSEFHHHWLGTHCATEWTEMRVGIPGLNSCHLNFLQAVEPFGLREENIRDNVNLFQKMRPVPGSGKIQAALSESKQGDYIEFYAEIDLLAAVTVCPNGDNTRYYSVPGKDLVRPLAIEIYDTGVQPRDFPRWADWRPAWKGKWMPLES